MFNVFPPAAGICKLQPKSFYIFNETAICFSDSLKHCWRYSISLKIRPTQKISLSMIFEGTHNINPIPKINPILEGKKKKHLRQTIFKISFYMEYSCEKLSSSFLTILYFSYLKIMLKIFFFLFKKFPSKVRDVRKKMYILQKLKTM